ncbi:MULTISPECIES: hypothetical protein [Acinetobacter]|nr:MULTISPECIES: hypothetical protein [Acinetobacter]MBJ8444728.1 hypothetical protein [Acinetobacter bereziniae]MBJ8453706.1 hypothetical protein [Acinetobacter bereziniae]MBJ8458118.1 hypothetical protein [Acinetobacter bereziniae]MBJ9371776.1 hypothetical protein [Acinetobacter sp. TGL-Y2]MCM8513913.1 hypothetical protein [Acinetobacter bereziniae]
MKLIIYFLGFLFMTNSFAGVAQPFEDEYYRLQTKFIEAQTNSNDVYRYPDGNMVTKVEDKIKIQAARDCLTWKAERDFDLHILNNFKEYESAKEKSFFINASKDEWLNNLKYLNEKINNPENKCI